MSYCGGIKNKTVAQVFFRFVYRWLILKNPQEAFIGKAVSCARSFTMNRQRRTKIDGITSMKKLINSSSGSFENSASGNHWSCLRIGDAREYL